MLIIDTHCHAGNNWFEPIETLEFEMERNGVDKAVLIQHGGTYDNTYLLQEAAKRPGRFKVAVLVDPESRDPLGDLAQLAEQGAAWHSHCPKWTIRQRRPLRYMAQSRRTRPRSLQHRGNAAQFAADDFSRVLDACPGHARHPRTPRRRGLCRAALRRLRQSPTTRQTRQYQHQSPRLGRNLRPPAAPAARTRIRPRAATFRDGQGRLRRATHDVGAATSRPAPAERATPIHCTVSSIIRPLPTATISNGSWEKPRRTCGDSTRKI